MGSRQNWEDIYALEVLPSSVATLAAAIAAGAKLDGTSKGVAGLYSSTNMVYNLLPADDYPQLKAPYESVEKQYATGKSLDNMFNITPVAGLPELVTVPVVFNAHNLSAFFRLLMQTGSSIANGVSNTNLEIMTCVPYVEPDPIYFANIMRFKQDAEDSGSIDQMLQGCVLNQIVLRGNEFGLLEGEIQLAGAKWTQSDLSAKLANASNFDDLPPLKFEDAVIKMNGVAINSPSFEITITSNVKRNLYNENYVKYMLMGRLKAEGNITVPWNDPSAQGSNKQINDYIAGIDKTLSIVWGKETFDVGTNDFGVDTNSAGAKNGVNNNYFGLHMNMKLSDYEEQDDEDNPMLNTSFRMVQDKEDTYNTLTVAMGYDKTKNSWAQ